MKFTLPFIKKGQRLSAEVIEVISGQMCIVNLHGDLIRIKNSTGRIFAPGDSMKLEVVGVNPLSFKVVSESTTRFSKTI